MRLETPSDSLSCIFSLITEDLCSTLLAFLCLRRLFRNEVLLSRPETPLSWCDAGNGNTWSLSCALTRSRVRLWSGIVALCLPKPWTNPPRLTVWPQRKNEKKKKKTPLFVKTRSSASWERHANTHVLSVRRPSLTWTLLAYASQMDGDSCRDLDPSLSIRSSLQTGHFANAAFNHCWDFRPNYFYQK